MFVSVTFRLLLQRMRDAAVRALCCTGCLWLFLSPALPAGAQASIPGAEAAELASAVETWLESEEQIALPQVAALARSGNQAAQLLLAIIDKTPALQGPWLAHLSRAERIALLRQPGGLSGRSWLSALADHPLGAAWQTLMRPSAGIDVMGIFTDLGEHRGAREALVVLASREHPRLRDIDPDTIDPELLYLLWRNADDARRADLLDRVPDESPQRLLMGVIPNENRFADWLQESDAGAPLDAVCSTFCAATRGQCLDAAYTALASHNALLTLGSPIEALVTQEAFLASPRGRASVLRRILQTHDARGRRALITQMRVHDACLAGVLEEEATRYRYRRPGSEGQASD